MAKNPPESYKRRLAIAVCRGPKQMQIVNEMLVGPVTVRDDHWGGSRVHYDAKRGQLQTQASAWLTVGISRVSWSSFRALKARLISVGFIFQTKNDPVAGAQIYMSFPEEDH